MDFRTKGGNVAEVRKSNNGESSRRVRCKWSTLFARVMSGNDLGF